MIIHTLWVQISLGYCSSTVYMYSIKIFCNPHWVNFLKQCGCLGSIRQAAMRHEIERGVVTVGWSWDGILVFIAETPPLGQFHGRSCRSSQIGGCLRFIAEAPRLWDVKGGAISFNLCSEVAFVSTANALGDIDHGVICSKVDSNMRLVDTTQRLLHTNYRAICEQVWGDFGVVRQTEALIQLRSRLSDRLSGYGDDTIVQTPTLTERGRRIAFGHVDLLVYIVIHAKTVTLHTLCGIGIVGCFMSWNTSSCHRLGGDSSPLVGLWFLHENTYTSQHGSR